VIYSSCRGTSPTRSWRRCRWCVTGAVISSPPYRASRSFERRGGNNQTARSRMRFLPTGIDGVHLVEPEPEADERGFFARLYCPKEFAAAGIAFSPRQTSLSYNRRRLTLRGLHYTTEPERSWFAARAVASSMWRSTFVQ